VLPCHVICVEVERAQVLVDLVDGREPLNGARRLRLPEHIYVVARRHHCPRCVASKSFFLSFLPSGALGGALHLGLAVLDR
jgi:hypothetical protein